MLGEVNRVHPADLRWRRGEPASLYKVSWEAYVESAFRQSTGNGKSSSKISTKKLTERYRLIDTGIKMRTDSGNSLLYESN